MGVVSTDQPKDPLVRIADALERIADALYFRRYDPVGDTTNPATSAIADIALSLDMYLPNLGSSGIEKILESIDDSIVAVATHIDEISVSTDVIEEKLHGIMVEINEK
jgi:hypothetical protein